MQYLDQPHRYLLDHSGLSPLKARGMLGAIPPFFPLLLSFLSIPFDGAGWKGGCMRMYVCVCVWVGVWVCCCMRVLSVGLVERWWDGSGKALECPSFHLFCAHVPGVIIQASRTKGTPAHCTREF
ncbi:hypothetical protein QBC33DRAFT_368061 [Phialemonium atrogriseum]|uniref:Uncharacterized protein n=1 Tax=Phialemonium atrogriseum TaxID=1093897 RepID=A0AAJ0FHU9_9PEZI|nr:uncharacterized protein QBC33DRAFT_368061 [Phialemonium atrogriseum]KAK1768971.1 hypothetical protein QBC33DRAFT_368061 [Phialemonium atrogriseum]